VGARLAEAGATGIICGSDLIAMGVLRALHESGRHVPGDVSVIGFDDAGPNAYVHPPLTSVQQPYEAMATATVQLLGTGPLTPGSRGPELRFRPELVVRGSTGAARLITADGLVPGPSDAASDALLEAAAASARGALRDAAVTELPHVAAWRDAYRAFGAKPQRTRNSLEALLRRVGAGLPRIDRLTDTYNAIGPPPAARRW
jgi:hypothetical protein